MGDKVDFDILYNEYGKPYLNLTNIFSYNISHSGNWVVIAYGNSEVGVDIERMQEGNEDLADKFFSKEEKNYIYSVSGQERTKIFTLIWTLKESYIKYLGTGLSTSLESFSVNPIKGVVTNQNGEDQRELSLKNFLFDKDYYLSICSVEEEVSLREIKLEELIVFINRSKEEER